jgi:hypothetical protein
MRIWHQELEPGSCIEVLQDDRLIGYVIHFSGGWDCYVAGGNGDLRKIASNLYGKTEAISETKRRAME